MAHNRFTSVPFLARLSEQLYSLDLAFNDIESVHNVYDVIFPRLHVLGLEFNHIKYISLSRLHMPNLGTLSINNNDLVTIDPIGVLLNGVSTSCHYLEVFLRGNRWHCNDSLSWIYDDKNLTREAHESNLVCTSPSCQVYSVECRLLVCQTPTELRGKHIITLCKLSHWRWIKRASILQTTFFIAFLARITNMFVLKRVPSFPIADVSSLAKVMARFHQTLGHNLNWWWFLATYGVISPQCINSKNHRHRTTNPLVPVTCNP